MISGLTVGVRVEAWKNMRAPMKSVVCQRQRNMQVMDSWHGVVRRNTRTLDKRVLSPGGCEFHVSSCLKEAR